MLFYSYDKLPFGFNFMYLQFNSTDAGIINLYIHNTNSLDVTSISAINLYHSLTIDVTIP